MTVAEIADREGVSHETVRYWIRCGDLRASLVTGRVSGSAGYRQALRIDHEEYERFAQSRGRIEPLLKKHQAARKMGCSVPQLDRRVQAGEIPVLKLGGSVRFEPHVLRQVMAMDGLAAAPDPAKAPSDPPAKPHAVLVRKFEEILAAVPEIPVDDKQRRILRTLHHAIQSAYRAL